MNRLRRERDIAPGHTSPAATSGISESSVSCPLLSTIACLKLGCSDDSRLARNLVPSSTPSAPSMIAAASPRPSAIPPAASTGMGATASTTIGTSVMVVCQPTCPPPSVPCAMITSAPACAARTASGTPPAMNVTLQPAAWARSTYGFTSCSGRGQAKAITEGRSVSAGCERIVLDIEQQEVQGKRPICQFANGGRPGMNLLGRQVMAAHGAQTARTGHGCHELRRVHRAHAAERDGMIDLQEVAY